MYSLYRKSNTVPHCDDTDVNDDSLLISSLENLKKLQQMRKQLAEADLMSAKRACIELDEQLNRIEGDFLVALKVLKREQRSAFSLYVGQMNSASDIVEWKSKENRLSRSLEKIRVDKVDQLKKLNVATNLLKEKQSKSRLIEVKSTKYDEILKTVQDQGNDERIRV